MSLISPLANLLVAPIVPLAMLGAFIGVLIGPLLVAPVISIVTAPLTLAAWAPLMLMVRGANLLAGVPLANLELAAPFDMASALVALGALVAALRIVHARGHGTTGPNGPPATGPPPVFCWAMIRVSGMTKRKARAHPGPSAPVAGSNGTIISMDKANWGPGMSRATPSGLSPRK